MTEFKAGDKIRVKVSFGCDFGEKGEVFNLTSCHIHDGRWNLTANPLSGDERHNLFCYFPEQHLELVVKEEVPEYVEVEGFIWCEARRTPMGSRSTHVHLDQCPGPHRPLFTERHVHSFIPTCSCGETE